MPPVIELSLLEKARLFCFNPNLLPIYGFASVPLRQRFFSFTALIYPFAIKHLLLQFRTTTGGVFQSGLSGTGELAAKLRGGLASVFFEENKKILDVPVAHLFGDLFHGLVGIPQELTGLVDADVLDGVVDGHAGGGAELAV